MKTKIDPVTAHDIEFWYPSQPSRRSAVAVVVSMAGVLLIASVTILAAVV